MQGLFEYFSDIPYMEDALAPAYQMLDLWLPAKESDGNPHQGYWIVFLHGGAWHDPEITATFAEKAATILQRSKVFAAIAGIASLNYRLSPWITHPVLPSSPTDSGRQAIHPDHLNDVVSGIQYLQRRFQFGDRYVLAGHSCGATLAYQTLTWKAAHDASAYIAPQAIVGVAGLYDLVLLRDMDPEPPMCQEFLGAAFGPDESVWRHQSPAYFDYEKLWPTGRLAVLAICLEDEYVSPQQREKMTQALKPWGNGRGRSVKMLGLYGGHDDIWKTGVGLASCLEETLSHFLAVSAEPCISRHK